MSRSYASQRVAILALRDDAAKAAQKLQDAREARADAEALAMPAPQAVAAPAKRGSAAYYLQRLDAAHPAIAKRVHAGELSVDCSGIAEGAEGLGEMDEGGAYMQDSVTA